MNAYTTKPESKFEDVPEEVLTDPTMRTALGMDPIPGMNIPVDEPKVSTFTTSSTTAAPEVTAFKNLVHPEFGELRTVEINGEPWFVGKDICIIFNDTNHNRSLGRIDPEDKKILPLKDALGRTQKAIFINESGLYALLFAMQPQKANNNGVSDAYPIEVQARIQKLHDFKHWVTSEVLPSIRKNGAYIRNQENMTPAEIVARGLIAAQKIIEEREKEIVHLNDRCGRLTQTIAEKQDVINAISRNVPAPTKRMMLNRVMRRRSPELAQSRWSYLYARFEEIYHKNVKIRMKNYNAEPGHRKCTSILDFIDTVLNMLDELYDLAVKLFESDFTQLMQEMHLVRMTDEEFESEEYWKRVL